jgi:hypothetical protein
MQIKPYEFTPRPVQPTYSKETGGFNAKTQKMVPMSLTDEELAGCDIFDNITLAAEAGLLDTEKWVKQLFAGLEDFEYFLDVLTAYNEEFTVYDRWWEAFSKLAHSRDTPGFSTSEEIAAVLLEQAQKTGQV